MSLRAPGNQGRIITEVRAAPIRDTPYGIRASVAVRLLPGLSGVQLSNSAAGAALPTFDRFFDFAKTGFWAL